ncbi:hypothetical protein GCM10029992_65930 [Glycomyces albus]
MVFDVPQQPLELEVDPVLLEPRSQLAAHVLERGHRSVELDDLAAQLVDAPGDLDVAAEDLGLDLVEVAVDPGQDGE